MKKIRKNSARTARSVAPARSARPAPTLLEKVRKNVLFYGVEPKLVARTVSRLVQHSYRAGEIIFDESSRGRDLYLICRGKVRVDKFTKFGVESLLATLHEGDFFGELSLLDGLPRSARAVAADDCMIVSMSPAEVSALVKASSPFCFNLLSSLALRLRTMDQTYVVELDRNAIALKSKIDRLSTLIEASKIVNSAIDIDQLLGLILDVATRSIGADRGTLYLVDEATSELWSKVAQGRNNMVEIRLPIGKGLAGYVAKTGESINIPDAYKDPRFNPEIDRKSGYKTHNVLTMPMRNKSGKVVGVFQFLNKRDGPFTGDDESYIDALSIHAAIALDNARMAREMVQSERLSAVGRMASTIIHDIKNPMGTLRLYAQVIKKKAGGPEAAQMADEIIHQVDRFVNMTQEVLDFSRGVSEIELQEVDLEEVMESTLSFIERDLSKKGITLRRKFEYTGRCTLDVEKIVRVFYNLAANAADAMREGGTLSVLTRRKDNKIVIEFGDTGCGIPDAIRSRIFEPFFTSGKRHGTGLGLAIVKKIMDDHNGRIEIDSEVGKGTTVRLILPPA